MNSRTMTPIVSLVPRCPTDVHQTVVPTRPSHCVCCTDVTNSANKSKISDRVRHMCTVFDRICLIVEKDPAKSWEKDVTVKPL